MSKHQLWIKLKPYMNEKFLAAAFREMWVQRPLAVKIIRKKLNGELAGYGFIHFQTHDEVVDVMYKLNGRPIPGSNPICHFYLKLNTVLETGVPFVQGKHCAVWVGGLSTDVDDKALNSTFSKKYAIATAKVLYHESGISKGYGFVQFVVEDEYRDALINMNGYVGLGTKPLHVFSAVLKSKFNVENKNSENSTSNTALNAYYDPSEYLKCNSQWTNNDHASGSQHSQLTTKCALVQNLDSELVSYKRPFNIDIADNEFLNPELCLWDSLEYSQWFPYDIVQAH